MQTLADLESKFLAYERSIADSFDKIESRETSSEVGFKAINQLLVELKTLVGTTCSSRSIRARSEQERHPQRGNREHQTKDGCLEERDHRQDRQTHSERGDGRRQRGSLH